MAYVMRNGVAVYYEVHGSGPTVLLTHGFAATGRMWTPQMDLLTRKRRVVVWDMRGHGRTDSPEDPSLYSEAETVDDMAAILDAIGADKAIVGGHSLGGYMSMAFHCRFPERVAALLLCGTGPGYRRDDVRETWNERARAIGDAIREKGLADLRRYSAEMDPADHKSARGLVNAAYGMLTQRDDRIINSLGSVSAPTLVTVGAEDRGYLAGTEYLSLKIKGAQYAVFEGAGHAANIDKPQAFNAALAQFLASRVDPLGA